MNMLTKQNNPYNYIVSELPFIRPIYRTLFSRGRTYAAFERSQLRTILEKLAPTGTVLDPMSGYGVLSEVCRGMGLSTCCMEINPPSYLWQILNEPSYKEQLLQAVRAASEAGRKIKVKKDFEASDEWFPNESIQILQSLWGRALRALGDANAVYLAAILLPFVGRLSAHGEGTLNIQVKKGGIVFYKDWEADFLKYLSFLSNIVSKYESLAIENKILLLDSLEPYELKDRYSYMVTSPPYPNMRDYYAFFFPENYIVETIFSLNKISSPTTRGRIIGSSKVSNFKKENEINFETLTSIHAKSFLIKLKEWKGAKRSMDDNKSYYIPYYFSYFMQLEKAYRNIESILDKNFDGYVIVVNNTARKFIIPVAQVVKELWNNMGYCVEVDDSLTNERAHVGSINPRAIGFKARHMEYSIRITKG